MVDGRLYSIGPVNFESLVDLINYYERHPFYKKIRLCHPVNEEVVQRMGQVSFLLMFYYLPNNILQYHLLLLTKNFCQAV